MQRRPVRSSNVSSVGWEDDVLEVEFHSGHVYRYEGVPQSEYEALVGAASVSQYLNQHIIGQYDERAVR